MKLIMITKDGLETEKDCYEVEDSAKVLMRPLLPNSPTPNQTSEWRKTMPYRRYERTGEIKNGLPVFREEE